MRSRSLGPVVATVLFASCLVACGSSSRDGATGTQDVVAPADGVSRDAPRVPDLVAVCRGDDDCDDQNPCTRDECAAGGACRHRPVVGAPCDDADPCTADGQCDEAGQCRPGPPLDLTPDPCVTCTCTPADGLTCTAHELFTACDDGDCCTTGDTCVPCAPGAPDCPTVDVRCEGTPLVCDAGAACADPACVCPEGSPVCALIPVPDGTPCDADPQACTDGDTCVAGACVMGPATPLDDGNPCTRGVCSKGLVTQVPLPAGAPCDDQNLCTEADRCDDEAICGGTPRECPDTAPLCQRPGCDPATGACGVPLPDGTPCDDGSRCTRDDACAGGVCRGVPLDCPPSTDPCLVVGCDDAGGCRLDPLDCPPDLPYCVAGTCVACIPGVTPPESHRCPGVCALYPPECVDYAWQCGGELIDEEICDGFDNDCDGDVDEGCVPCTVPLDRVRTALDTKWDIDFDYDCNAYLTTIRAGADFVTIVPVDPSLPIRNLYGNSNQNMGFALVDPDPRQRRVVVTYSCCAACACQAINGFSLLHDCLPAAPGCGCAGQTNCPGVGNFPFIRTGFQDTAVRIYGTGILSTPTGLAAGPANTYFSGNFRAERCWSGTSCVPCDPANPDVWCSPSVSPCCDTTSLGRLVQFTVPDPADGSEATWRVVHIFAGEQMAGLASGRDGSIWVGTYASATTGNLYRYDPVRRAADLVRTYPSTVFSITQDRRTGDFYVETMGTPRLHRLWEDGTERPLPPGIPENPTPQGVLQYGPDGRLYRLIISHTANATLEVYDLPYWARTGAPCNERVLCEAPAVCTDGRCIEH